MGLTTVGAIIDAARVRHWSFTSAEAGDGPALVFLRSRLATHLAKYGAMIEGLVGSTVSYALPITSATVLVTTTGATPGAGTLVLTDSYQDGWPIHADVDGNLYVDFSEPPIATDPFGVNGGVVGFPLPADMIRLTSVALVYTNDAIIPCDIVPEIQRFTTAPGRNPSAFVSGNRLVPVLPLAANNTSSRWDNVTAVQISYVPVQAITTLADVLNLPSVLNEALIADVAHYFAMQSKAMPAADKVMFRNEATACAALIADAALDLLNESVSSNVLYKG